MKFPVKVLKISRIMQLAVFLTWNRSWTNQSFSFQYWLCATHHDLPIRAWI